MILTLHGVVLAPKLKINLFSLNAATDYGHSTSAGTFMFDGDLVFVRNQSRLCTAVARRTLQLPEANATVAPGNSPDKFAKTMDIHVFQRSYGHSH